jgi:hypothetical protein
VGILDGQYGKTLLQQPTRHDRFTWGWIIRLRIVWLAGSAAILWFAYEIVYIGIIEKEFSRDVINEKCVYLALIIVVVSAAFVADRYFTRRLYDPPDEE